MVLIGPIGVLERAPLGVGEENQKNVFVSSLVGGIQGDSHQQHVRFIENHQRLQLTCRGVLGGEAARRERMDEQF